MPRCSLLPSVALLLVLGLWAAQPHAAAQQRAQLAPASAYWSTPSNCSESDASLHRLWSAMCLSLSDPAGCPGADNVTAEHDWPNQAIYMRNLLEGVVASSTCLNTTYAGGLLRALEAMDTTTSPWWNTWTVFQVEYYDMPRRPGERIESPATLGRKCWAFEYLAQLWGEQLRPALLQAAHTAGVTLDAFVAAYDAAVPLTMGVCDKVLANCFVNKSYDPAVRNGTCPDQEGQFFVGFQWENGQRNNSLPYHFPAYDQTDVFRNYTIFAVNTALNFII